MTTLARLRTGFTRGFFTTVLLIVVAATLSAHAVLTKSQPAANGKVKGPSFPVVLTFNSRIDQSRSTLTLEGPGQTTSSLTVTPNASAPDKLFANASDVKPGPHKIHWQVLSVDGHITRGQIAFEVE